VKKQRNNYAIAQDFTFNLCEHFWGKENESKVSHIWDLNLKLLETPFFVIRERKKKPGSYILNLKFRRLKGE
jgi:hypothetical protein